MTRLAILNSQEKHRFDRPPTLGENEQQLYFSVAAELRDIVDKIHNTDNKIGFILQLGYFRASGKFFPTSLFRAKDVQYVAKYIGISLSELSTYPATVCGRHRKRILAHLNWSSSNRATDEALQKEAAGFAINQANPKDIFRGLVDFCWKRQWVIPAYYDLAHIITDALNDADQILLTSLEHTLSQNEISQLENLLTPLLKPG